jgi:DNA-binding PadR family transcriptional regulator
MLRRRKLSTQTLAVLQGLSVRPTTWRHGYDLTRELGLKSGTLYPLLMRLTDEGLLESEWQAPARPGLPARHAYRITPAGMAAAVAAAAQRDDLRSDPDDGGLLPA